MITPPRASAAEALPGGATSSAVPPAEAAPGVNRPDQVERVPPPEDRIDESQVRAAVSAIEERAASLQRSLKFGIDEHTGRTIVTVTNRETGEVIRQIPPEETLAIAARLKEATVGLLLAVKA